MMNNGLLLWVDDEIELLKAHILFLEKKGYEVETVSNGQDALGQVQRNGLRPDSARREHARLERVGDLVAHQGNHNGHAGGHGDEERRGEYHGPSHRFQNCRPPHQARQPHANPPDPEKKNIHKKEIVTEVAQNAYQQNFGKIGMQINDSLTFDDWKEVYKRLVYWELELSETDSNMDEMLSMQKTEANLAFAKFISKHYEEWITHPENRPLMSPDIFKNPNIPPC